ncbi:MAG TPA: hypothetical protein VMM82_13845, partial [Spirochaetia bacterium]|nr:hypothetical protein [Spirochaetia bacterium]
AAVVIGFTRFGTYAIARSTPRSMVFASRQEETALMGRSSIEILPLSHRAKSTLRKLEIRTVRQFVSLPEGEAMRRFGGETALLRKAMLSDDPLPIQSLALKETAPCARHLDAPLVDLNLLMPHIDELLAIEAGRVEKKRAVISELTLVLRTEDGEISTDIIRPAVPTLRTHLLQRLILLRLSSRQLSSGVEDIELRSACTTPSRGQEELFAVRARDLRAGGLAFAALRARFGNDAVCFAELSDSHLPERSFRWVTLQRPVLPAPSRDTGEDRCEDTREDGRKDTREDGRVRSRAENPTAVRRIFFTPRQLEGSLKQVRLAGPFVVSGSWWGAGEEDAPFLRHYCYRDSPEGILWLYSDAHTHTTWVQGAID